MSGDALAPASAGDGVEKAPQQQRELTVVRVATGTTQSLALRKGRTVRIGHARGNDVLIDTNGVSARHLELSFGELGADGHPQLCALDLSRNGTGIRNPAAGVGNALSSWEALTKGEPRVLGDGWQVKLPLKSRKNGTQVLQSTRTLTLQLGHWHDCPLEPALAHLAAPPPSAAPPPALAPAARAPAYVPAPATSAAAAAEALAAAMAKKAKDKKEKKVGKKKKERAEAGALAPPPQAPPAEQPVGRWKKRASRAQAEVGDAEPPANPQDLYAEIDKEIGLNAAKEADGGAAALPPGSATRPKQRARPPRGLGGDDEISSGEVPEASPGLRLTQSTLNAVAGAAAAAHFGRRPEPSEPGFVVGQSILRDMSVSPISTPGVGLKKKRKKTTAPGSEDSDAPKKKPKKGKKDNVLRPGTAASSPGDFKARSKAKPKVEGKVKDKKEKQKRGRSERRSRSGGRRR